MYQCHVLVALLEKAKFPNISINNKFQNFPRPYSTYKPHAEDYLFINKKLFPQFIKHTKAKVIQ